MFLSNKSLLGKQTIAKIFIATILLSVGFTACKDNEEPPPQIEGPIDWELRWKTSCYGYGKPQKAKEEFMSCLFVPFIDSYLIQFQCDNVYFVKGIAQDTVYEYGRNIKLLEDLKGNFPQDIGTIFTAFGAGYFNHNDFVLRVDYLPIYKKQDTLLMLLISGMNYWEVRDLYIPQREDEEAGYVTTDCCHSVLQLSNDSVIGRIYYKEDIGYKVYPDTIPYKYFQKRLQEIK